MSLETKIAQNKDENSQERIIKPRIYIIKITINKLLLKDESDDNLYQRLNPAAITTAILQNLIQLNSHYKNKKTFSFDPKMQTQSDEAWKEIVNTSNSLFKKTQTAIASQEDPSIIRDLLSEIKENIQKAIQGFRNNEEKMATISSWINNLKTMKESNPEYDQWVVTKNKIETTLRQLNNQAHQQELSQHTMARVEELDRTLTTMIESTHETRIKATLNEYKGMLLEIKRTLEYKQMEERPKKKAKTFTRVTMPKTSTQVQQGPMDVSPHHGQNLDEEEDQEDDLALDTIMKEEITQLAKWNEKDVTEANHCKFYKVFHSQNQVKMEQRLKDLAYEQNLPVVIQRAGDTSFGHLYIGIDTRKERSIQVNTRKVINHNLRQFHEDKKTPNCPYLANKFVTFDKLVDFSIVEVRTENQETLLKPFWKNKESLLTALKNARPQIKRYMNNVVSISPALERRNRFQRTIIYRRIIVKGKVTRRGLLFFARARVEYDKQVDEIHFDFPFEEKSYRIRIRDITGAFRTQPQLLWAAFERSCQKYLIPETLRFDPEIIQVYEYKNMTTGYTTGNFAVKTTSEEAYKNICTAFQLKDSGKESKTALINNEHETYNGTPVYIAKLKEEEEEEEGVLVGYGLG